MKRLLAVILVPIMATAANAVQIVVEGQVGPDVDPGCGYTITIIGEDTSSWLGYIIIEEGGSAVLSNPVVLWAAGDMASASAYEEAGWGAGYELNAAAGPDGTILAGPQF